MAAAALSLDSGKASWLWLMAYFIVITVAELYLSPISLSLVTKIAPARALSMMMGAWMLTYTGGFLGGYLGSLWSGMAKGPFFLMIAAIAAAAGLVILAFVRPLKAALGES
jgi:POT family proton-dependent oligopeptide transporter